MHELAKSSAKACNVGMVITLPHGAEVKLPSFFYYTVALLQSGAYTVPFPRFLPMIHKSFTLCVAHNANGSWTVLGEYDQQSDPFLTLTAKWSLSYLSRSCSHATPIIAVATKQGWRLFRSRSWVLLHHDTFIHLQMEPEGYYICR